MEIYLVGGAVRDELLGLPVQERDWVVVGSTEQEMLAKGFQKVGKDFPVFLHPETHEEYALARTERKTGKGYYGFACYSSPQVTLIEDLQRRDLTINAIAKAQDGTIIDPFNGQAALKQRVLQHVSLAFSEDPVRILRVAKFAARFAALGFTVAPATQELMLAMVAANEVDTLVPERVWQELQQALTTANPEVFIQVLKTCKALERLLPELAALWGIPQDAKCHPEIDTGAHILLALAAVSKLTKDPKVRFAVLLHDVGKIATSKELWPAHPGHAEAGIAIVKKICQQYRVPNAYKNFAIKFTRWHMDIHNITKLAASEICQLLTALEAFRDDTVLTEFLLAAESDHLGRAGMQDLPYPQAKLLRGAFAVAKQITAEQFLAKGFTGEQLGQQIQQARIQAIAKFCKTNIAV